MRHRKSPLYLFGRFWPYLILIATSFLMFIPFYWSVSTSLKLEQFVFTNPPQWWPNPLTLQNYVGVFTKIHFYRNFNLLFDSFLLG